MDQARLQAAISLRTVCNSVNSIETIKEMEKGVHEAYQKLKGEERNTSTTRQALEFQVMKLLGEIVAKKNELASKRDILLDDIPKFPKKNGVYQQLRRTVRNG